MGGGVGKHRSLDRNGMRLHIFPVHKYDIEVV
jgi:hypothetical protein